MIWWARRRPPPFLTRRGVTILYVDAEHERVRKDPLQASRHNAQVELGGRRLARAAGDSCVVTHAVDLDMDRVRESEPSAIVLSGSTTDWSHYDFEALAGLLDVIRLAPVPILGICAGHQLIGYAHGARWGPLGPLSDDELDPDPRFAEGQRKERGYTLVDLDPGCPLFEGLATQATFFQSHYWQLEEVPSGFSTRAHTSRSPIQAIERFDRVVFGVQFHPEWYDARYQAGHRLLRNFFDLARNRPD